MIEPPYRTVAVATTFSPRFLQVLAEHATVAKVGSEGGVFQELVFHKDAVPGVNIIIRSCDGLPGEVGMAGAAAGVERAEGSSGRIGNVTANSETDVGLEFSIREFHEAVRHEGAGVHGKAGAAVSGDAVYDERRVGAGLPSVIEHVFFQRETNRAGSENVADLDAAKKAGVIGGIEAEGVPVQVGEISDITTVLINVGSEIDGPVPTGPVNFWWRRRSGFGTGGCPPAEQRCAYCD